ncbi:hypothetical protein H920_05632 [Fukomys damarensis]|uniref:Uncharacterized protein n=1 Tax=Fukomys damarensis TaxID=885580 RepID=A0A091ECG5_FUKDA|nr:hypothetical protein H920_05632 [Fukomys damarensis]
MPWGLGTLASSLAGPCWKSLRWTVQVARRILVPALQCCLHSCSSVLYLCSELRPTGVSSAEASPALTPALHPYSLPPQPGSPGCPTSLCWGLAGLLPSSGLALHEETTGLCPEDPEPTLPSFCFASGWAHPSMDPPGRATELPHDLRLCPRCAPTDWAVLELSAFSTLGDLEASSAESKAEAAFLDHGAIG